MKSVSIAAALIAFTLTANAAPTPGLFPNPCSGGRCESASKSRWFNPCAGGDCEAPPADDQQDVDDTIPDTVSQPTRSRYMQAMRNWKPFSRKSRAQPQPEEPEESFGIADRQAGFTEQEQFDDPVSQFGGDDAVGDQVEDMTGGNPWAEDDSGEFDGMIEDAENDIQSTGSGSLRRSKSHQGFEADQGFDADEAIPSGSFGRSKSHQKFDDLEADQDFGADEVIPSGSFGRSKSSDFSNLGARTEMDEEAEPIDDLEADYPEHSSKLGARTEMDEEIGPMGDFEADEMAEDETETAPIKPASKKGWFRNPWTGQ
jgi:hypothetical protein